MKNLTVKASTRSIEVSKKFNTLASRYGTDEYKMLQEVRRDYALAMPDGLLESL